MGFSNAVYLCAGIGWWDGYCDEISRRCGGIELNEWQEIWEVTVDDRDLDDTDWDFWNSFGDWEPWTDITEACMECTANDLVMKEVEDGLLCLDCANRLNSEAPFQLPLPRIRSRCR